MARITAEQAAKWIDLNTRRLELEREARVLDKERELLSLEFQQALDAKGQESMKVGGGEFVVKLVEGNGSVKWKDEFIRLAGAAKATELTAAAPKPKKVVVEKAA